MQNLNNLTVIPDYQDSRVGKQIIWGHKGTDLYSPAYLHGELQYIAGFDIVYHIESTENQVVELPDKIRGEVKVKVFIHKDGFQGIKEGILVWYIYENKKQSYKNFRGLIVAENDAAAYAHAKLKQKERSSIL